MSDTWDCDCEVVDDPDMVCPIHMQIWMEERTALTAELERLMMSKTQFCVHCEKYAIVRDAYKLDAERLAKALEEHASYLERNNIFVSPKYKEALSAHEALRGKAQ